MEMKLIYKLQEIAVNLDTIAKSLPWFKSSHTESDMVHLNHDLEKCAEQLAEMARHGELAKLADNDPRNPRCRLGDDAIARYRAMQRHIQFFVSVPHDGATTAMLSRTIRDFVYPFGPCSLDRAEALKSN